MDSTIILIRFQVPEDLMRVYGLIYAIEHSKDLMKIQTAELVTNTIVDSKGVPHYIVKFTLLVKEYYSQSDQYAAVIYTENNLKRRGSLNNAFYPLVRSEIRPNTENLPDIQGASLISLVPQGAFIIGCFRKYYSDGKRRSCLSG